jgi:hypothetical protein
MSTHSRRQPALVHSTPRLLRLALAGLLALGLTAPALAVGPTALADPGRGNDARPRHVQQRLTLHVLPGITQPGRHAAASSDAREVVNATLEPPTKGRPIRLERRGDGAWVTVGKAVSGAAGAARFHVDARRPGATYRAIAPAWRGHPSLRSDLVADGWGRPDFVDEFDGAALGPAWQHRIQFYNPWGGRACSKGDPSAVAVADGTLRLSSAVDPAATGLCAATDEHGQPLGSFPYRVNGHVSTQHSADFLYGVAAARMRFPRSLGQHAAFWLQPRGLLTTGPTPWGAEVDVVEWYGARGRREVMGSAVHEPMPGGTKRQHGGLVRNPDRFLASRSDSWWTRFHVFSVEWTPTEYVFRIDGRVVWRTDEGVSDVPEFLILSMLSSDFELPMVGTDPTPRTAEVDWVAFWQAS